MIGVNLINVKEDEQYELQVGKCVCLCVLEYIFFN